MMASASPIPIQQWLRRQQRRTWIFGALLAVSVLSLGIWRGSEAVATERWTRHTHHLKQIHSNGSLRLSQANQSVDIMLQGVGSIDEAARAWIEKQWSGQTVRIGLDPRHSCHKNGRPLVYLYDNNGRMLNEQLIIKGLAKPAGSRHRLSKWFDRLGRRASQ